MTYSVTSFFFYLFQESIATWEWDHGCSHDILPCFGTFTWSRFILWLQRTFIKEWWADAAACVYQSALLLSRVFCLVSVQPLLLHTVKSHQLKQLLMMITYFIVYLVKLPFLFLLLYACNLTVKKSIVFIRVLYSIEQPVSYLGLKYFN